MRLEKPKLRTAAHVPFFSVFSALEGTLLVFNYSRIFVYFIYIVTAISYLLVLCSNEHGVTYVLDCFSPAQQLCPATVAYLRNSNIIEFNAGGSMTFAQLADKTTAECEAIGGISFHLNINMCETHL